MSILKSVEIWGFRGHNKIKINFDKNTNFLIGKNGTGKTNIINIISSLLQCDFKNLTRLPFSKAKINIKNLNTRAFSYIEYDKEDTESPFFKLTLFNAKKEIRNIFFVRDDGVFYPDVETNEDNVRIVERWSSLALRNPARFKAPSRRGDPSSPFSIVNELVKSSWLSVHRGEIGREHVEGSYETSVDTKLRQIYNDLPRFFSSLDSKAALLFHKFQETYFLSLLFDKNVDPSMMKVERFNLEQEKQSLEQIFNSLKLSKKTYKHQLDSHFEFLKESYSAYDDFVKPGSTSIKSEFYHGLLNAKRIHKIVQEWNHYQEERKTVYEPKTEFLEIINELFSDKNVSIDDRNAPSVTLSTDTDKKIPLTGLSSGEKQMFILLGEALLQEQKPWVYIADEPELSLHLEWQELLVSSLKKINPAAQILFATHSPEILGPYGDNAIDMAELLV